MVAFANKSMSISTEFLSEHLTDVLTKTFSAKAVEQAASNDREAAGGWAKYLDTGTSPQSRMRLALSGNDNVIQDLLAEEIDLVAGGSSVYGPVAAYSAAVVALVGFVNAAVYANVAVVTLVAAVGAGVVVIVAFVA